MRYLNFLAEVHQRLEPPTYLEIGIRHGDSLALSRSRSVGIDPAYNLQVELPAAPALFRETSDEYFERAEPLEPLGGERVALSFIDGMHLAEFALRDFVNVERLTDWTSVVVFDDILPADVDMAARDRHTNQWTGDVYKVLGVLAQHRPDLICLRVGTEPTGLLLVLGLDPDSRVLSERLDDLVAELVVADPQEVPDDVLQRRGVLDPQAVLDASFWGVLRDARSRGVSRKEGLKELRRALRDDFGDSVSGEPRGLRRLLRRSA